MSIKFKTKQAVDDYFSGDKIECLLCHKRFKAIGGKHLAYIHKISVTKYKEMFGLPMGRGLISESTFIKQANALKVRIESGDDSLTKMTPELMNKAQHSPKRKFPTYHINQMKDFAVLGQMKIKKRSARRANEINWDRFLTEIKFHNAGFNSLKNITGMPSYYDLRKKLNNDIDFKNKYESMLIGFLKSTKLSNEIMRLTRIGKSQRDIARFLPISKTQIARIQRENGGK
jgi:hypothetical protein